MFIMISFTKKKKLKSKVKFETLHHTLARLNMEKFRLNPNTQDNK